MAGRQYVCAQTMWPTRLLAFFQHSTEPVHRLGNVVLWLMKLVGERVSLSDSHMPSEAELFSDKWAGTSARLLELGSLTLFCHGLP